jgi:hypothetical protein
MASQAILGRVRAHSVRHVTESDSTPERVHSPAWLQLAIRA